MAFRQRSNIRSKSRYLVQDEEGDDDASAIKSLSDSVSKVNVKAKKEKTTQNLKLSFGDDDEEMVYAAKKTKSRGLLVSSLAASRAEPTAAVAGTSYSHDDLAQLKKATPRKPEGTQDKPRTFSLYQTQKLLHHFLKMYSCRTCHWKPGA